VPELRKREIAKAGSSDDRGGEVSAAAVHGLRVLVTRYYVAAREEQRSAGGAAMSNPRPLYFEPEDEL